MKVLLDRCGAGTVAAELTVAGHEVECVADWPRDPGDEVILDKATAWCVLMCERNGNVRASAFVGHVALGGLIGGAIDKIVNRGRTIYQRRPTPTIHIGVGPRGGNVTVVF